MTAREHAQRAARLVDSTNVARAVEVSIPPVYAAAIADALTAIALALTEPPNPKVARL